MRADPPLGGTAVSAVADFDAILARIDGPADAGLLPMRLSQACAQLLGVDGAGISIFGDFRVPLGASSAQAAEAERLQFTIGTGPCLQAVTDGHSVRATERDLARDWPVLYAELHRLTTFRSIASLPIQIDDEGAGAIDLYLTDPTQVQALDLVAAEQVADHIAGMLAGPGLGVVSSLACGPSLLNGPDSDRRFQLWIALGLVHVQLDYSPPDALALLRAYSFSHDLVLDDVASSLVTRVLSAEQLQR